MTSRLFHIIVGLSLALTVGLPLWRSGFDVGTTASYLVQVAIPIAIFAIVTIGLNVQLGYAGIDNFGIAGFFMIGAYVAAIMVVPAADGVYARYVGGFGPALDIFPALATAQWLPHLIGVIAAIAVCVCLALLLTLLTPRLRHDYLAIATIGLAELLRSATIVEDGLVNGDRGLIGITQPFAGLVEPGTYPVFFLLLICLVLAGIYVATEVAVRSPWGRALRALREDELAVTAIGKNPLLLKMQSFVLGAAIMGIGSALYAYYRQGLTPSDFEPLQGTFLFWVMLIVGGTGNNRGAILGAVVIWCLWVSTLQLAAFDLPDAITSRMPYLRYVALGVFFIAMLNLRPQGLLPANMRVSSTVERLARRNPLPDQARHDGAQP
ncbi:MAG: branched-chain amino acid ABC transporter permease [Parvibaculaceae bacterium]